MGCSFSQSCVWIKDPGPKLTPGEPEIRFFANILTIHPKLKFVWIDPNANNTENLNYLRQFQKHISIETFTSVQTLRQKLTQEESNQIRVISASSFADQSYQYLTTEPKIKDIFLFCQNEQRAKLLKSNFPKIKYACFKANKVIQTAKKIEQESIKDPQNKNTLLCQISDDINLINKYRFNYHYLLTQQSNDKNKSNFVLLARQLFPSQQQKIESFVNDYKMDQNGDEKFQKSLAWAFQDSFFWTLIENLPKLTTDPRKLAYLRTPIKDLYDKTGRKKDRVYLVIQLSSDQKEKVNNNLNNYLTFTTFIKGFTNQNIANQQFRARGVNAFKFELWFPKGIRFQDLYREKPSDSGFVILEKDTSSNVIFNINNFFKLKQFDLKQRTGSLSYASLTDLILRRKINERQSKLDNFDIKLLRNIDYLNSLKEKINSKQSILRFTGYIKQSLQLSPRKMNQSATQDKYYLAKGDTYKIKGQYREAQKLYKNIKTSEFKRIASLRLLELLFIHKDYKMVNETLQANQLEFNKLKEQKFMEEYFTYKNLMGLNMMRKKQYKKAKEFYKNLKHEALNYYQQSFEGIPIVHDIMKNNALNEAKLSNKAQAQNLLQIYKGWKISCEGETESLKRIEQTILSLRSSNELPSSILNIDNNPEEENLQESTIKFSLKDTGFQSV